MRMAFSNEFQARHELILSQKLDSKHLVELLDSQIKHKAIFTHNKKVGMFN